MFRYLWLCFFLFVHAQDDENQWHMSQVALKNLYGLQREHFDAFNVYLDAETKRLDELKNLLAHVNEYNRNITDKTAYLYNHVNGIKTIIRINNLLRDIGNLTNNEQSLDALKTIGKHKDLSGNETNLAQQGLRRLQLFYEIPVSDMVDGRHDGSIVGDPLNVYECYVMSKYCFEGHDMLCATDWAIQAYKKWTNGEDGDGDGGRRTMRVDIEKLKHYMISSSVYTGFDYTTLLGPDEIHYSEHTAALARHSLLVRNDVSRKNVESGQFDVFESHRNVIAPDKNFYIDTNEFINLCQRGKSARTSPKEAKCRYQTKNSPYRLLMPFKEEDFADDVLNIKLYHDVLYDNEIKHIISSVENQLSDSKFKNNELKNIRMESTRSSQTAWINPHPNNKWLYDPIDARIESITGYTTQTSENYQVVNYGLAGHYNVHHDPNGVRGIFGTRLMTVLIYLSDVEDYGHTVYPLVDIVSPVKKGTAVVWYNLYMNNGSLINKSQHGSCPILKGNKWIMTKWLYEEGQNLPYSWKPNS